MSKTVKITVLTVEKQPSFEVPSFFATSEVDALVFTTYGKQSSGSPHDWRGDHPLDELTKARKGEICYQLVMHRFKKSGVNLGNLKRELGNTASELDGVTVDELMSLVSDMLPEIIGEAFGFNHVTIKMSDEKS